MDSDSIATKAVNTLRAIACETISCAKSGHSGIALGAAPILYSVYNSMRIDTQHPDFFNRDRFVLSAGHGSALLYTMLHFAGFEISTDDLRKFRRLGSLTPGHPELHTCGVDVATGPLGQGIGMAVGIAVAEKKLAALFNRPRHKIIDHYTYCVAGDGCFMEGVSYESCNLAAVQNLNKLILIYDYNNVTLDGKREIADSEDVVKRFAAIGWNVLEVKNGNSTEDIMTAIAQAKTSLSTPSIIIVHTEIGFGMDFSGTSKAHGAVLSEQQITHLREKWGLTTEQFGVDKDVRKHFAQESLKHLSHQKEFMADLARYKKEYPNEYKKLIQFFEINSEAQTPLFKVLPLNKDVATRDAGHDALNQIAKQSPRLFGANADISSTTKAFIKDGGIFSPKNLDGTDLACGVRESAMGAIANGLALHGFTPYCSTFLAFSDYLKPAIRLGALMYLPITYIFSHDGIGNAPDGPTHQGTEHIASLRLIPNMRVFRPADDIETAATYKYIFENPAPSAVLLGRASVKSLKTPYLGTSEQGTFRGGYIVRESQGPLRVILIATGAEVALCDEAHELLTKAGIGVRVVSMPCCELFDCQSPEYISSVLDMSNSPIVIAVELGRGDAWYKYIGSRGTVIDFAQFGASGTQEEVLEHLGFTAQQIAKTALLMLKKR